MIDLENYIRSHPYTVVSDIALQTGLTAREVNDFVAANEELQQFVAIDKAQKVPSWAVNGAGVVKPGLHTGEKKMFEQKPKRDKALIVIPQPPPSDYPEFDNLQMVGHAIDTRLVNATKKQDKQDALQDKALNQKDAAHKIAELAKEAASKAEIIDLLKGNLNDVKANLADVKSSLKNALANNATQQDQIAELKAEIAVLKGDRFPPSPENRVN